MTEPTPLQAATAADCRALTTRHGLAGNQATLNELHKKILHAILREPAVVNGRTRCERVRELLASGADASCICGAARGRSAAAAGSTARRSGSDFILR